MYNIFRNLLRYFVKKIKYYFSLFIIIIIKYYIYKLYINFIFKQQVF